jgi:hypothetical protein
MSSSLSSYIFFLLSADSSAALAAALDARSSSINKAIFSLMALELAEDPDDFTDTTADDGTETAVGPPVFDDNAAAFAAAGAATLLLDGNAAAFAAAGAAESLQISLPGGS